MRFDKGANPVKQLKSVIVSSFPPYLALGRGHPDRKFAQKKESRSKFVAKQREPIMIGGVMVLKATFAVLGLGGLPTYISTHAVWRGGRNFQITLRTSFMEGPFFAIHRMMNDRA